MASYNVVDKGNMKAVTTPIQDVAQGLSVHASDILRESEAKFRNLILSLPAALYTTDCDGRITLFNDTAAEMWGRRPEIGIDMWCGSWKIYRPADGSEMPLDQCPMAVSLKEGRGVRGEEIIVERPDGTRACVLPHPEPLRDTGGNIVGAINMLVDITDRKRAEEQIQELNRSLEARVVERTAQLEAFCYSIAHDLRQHIRGINVNAHLVEELVTSTDPELRESVERLICASKHMDSLVTDLLSYARSSRQELRRETVDLSRLAHEVAAQLGDTYGSAEFRIQSGLKAVGDQASLSVVILNLLDNGCKYASRERQAVVQFGSQDGSFFVKDNGVGFNMIYAEQLFQPFQRLHRHADIPGTGIGLATVKQVVEKHGGRVWAESEHGNGSTFFFTLP
jgi:PAS domain S-box-containing protein